MCTFRSTCGSSISFTHPEQAATRQCDSHGGNTTTTRAAEAPTKQGPGAEPGDAPSIARRALATAYDDARPRPAVVRATRPEQSRPRLVILGLRRIARRVAGLAFSTLEGSRSVLAYGAAAAALHPGTRALVGICLLGVVLAARL